MDTNQTSIHNAILKCIETHGGTVTTKEGIPEILGVLGGNQAEKGDYNAVNSAAFNLRQRGAITSPSRGVWAITDTGKAVLAGAPMPKVAKTAGTTDNPDAAAAPADGASAPADAAAPADGTTPAPAAPAAPKRLKVAVAPVIPADAPEWIKDEQVRGLVIENSDCFGAWSAKVDACASCPLAGWCRTAKAGTLTLLASKITVADAALAAPPPVTAKVAKLDATVSKVNAPDAPRTTAVAEGPVMRASYDGVCAETGKPVKIGDQVRYVKGKGIVLV
jgi:hypothetical protein